MASKKETTRTGSDSPASAEQRRESAMAPRAAEAAARRGRVRDALAALANVEAMLRSHTDGGIDAEVEELRRGMSALHEVFEASVLEASDNQRDARRSLEAFAAGRIRAVDAALSDLRAPNVARALGALGVDLDTAAALLELVERSAEAAPLELSVATLAEQALRLAWTIRSHGAVAVYARSSLADCSVTCDPHVVARVLAIAVATVREVSTDVVVRTHVEKDAGIIEIAAYSPEDDESARIMQTRVLPRIAPTEAVLEAAARDGEITLHVEPGRILLRCPRAVS